MPTINNTNQTIAPLQNGIPKLFTNSKSNFAAIEITPGIIPNCINPKMAIDAIAV